MKKKNRICTSMLAMTLLAGMPAMSFMPLYAAGTADEHTVTLTGAIEGTTYKAYQIFKGTYDTRNDNTLGEIAWGEGVDPSKIISKLKGPWQLGENPTAAEVAGKLAETEKDPLTFRAAAESAVTGEGILAVTNEEGTKFTGLATGYYLVTESTGEGAGSVTRSFIMQVVGENTSITVKKSNTPTAEKHVQENTTAVGINGMLTAGGQGYQDAADYNVGDTIPFILKAGNLPTPDSIKDWKEYSVTFEDKMSGGLTLDEASIHVYEATSDANGVLTWSEGDELTKDKDAIVINTTANDDRTFQVEVPIKTAEKTKNYSGKTLVVTFNAKLNENAVHGIPGHYEEGNYNNFTLAYTNDPNTGAKKKTDEDHTLVFTYDMQVNKVDGTNTERKLAGAEFKVYKVLENTNYYYSLNDGVVEFTNDAAKAKVFTTDENGALKDAITGIDEGTYYITETKAPDGYNKLSEDIEVVLSAKKNNQLAVTTDNVNDVNEGVSYTIGETTADAPAATDTPVITVKNNKGTVLPSTGGMGTTVLYTVGGLLVVGAGVFLIAGKRMKKEED